MVTIEKGVAGQMTDVSLKLESSRRTAIHVALARSSSRISSLDRRNLVTASQAYNHGIASCQATSISPGQYVVTCSTFSAGEEDTFKLTASSSLPVKLEVIPAEGAGMFVQRMNALVSQSQSLRFKLESTQAMSVMARLQYKTSSLRPKTALNLSKWSEQPNHATVLVTSGAPSDSVCGVVLPLSQVGMSSTGFCLEAVIHEKLSDPGMKVRLIVYSDCKVKLHKC